MPDGHLPHLHAPQDLRHGAQPGHRRSVHRTRREGADLRHGPGRRRRYRPLTTNHTAHTRPSGGKIMSQNKITLTKEQADAFGRELDAIKEREMADLGEEDAEYIRRMIKIQRGLEVGGRALLFLPPTWLFGTGMLGIAKIMDNMEIGHNIMHGQYDGVCD